MKSRAHVASRVRAAVEKRVLVLKALVLKVIGAKLMGTRSPVARSPLHVAAHAVRAMAHANHHRIRAEYEVIVFTAWAQDP
tara:strand:+ start:89 stop:331 length:243 start_codon:yes stop_codon:yes gene_type:complete